VNDDCSLSKGAALGPKKLKALNAVPPVIKQDKSHRFASYSQFLRVPVPNSFSSMARHDKVIESLSEKAVKTKSTNSVFWHTSFFCGGGTIHSQSFVWRLDNKK